MRGEAADQTGMRGRGQRKGRKTEGEPRCANLRDQVSGEPTADTYRVSKWPRRILPSIPQHLRAKKEERDRKIMTKTRQKRKGETKTKQKQGRRGNRTRESERKQRGEKPYAARPRDSVSGEPPAATFNDSRARRGILAGRIHRFRDNWKRERNEKEAD